MDYYLLTFEELGQELAKAMNLYNFYQWRGMSRAASYYIHWKLLHAIRQQYCL